MKKQKLFIVLRTLYFKLDQYIFPLLGNALRKKIVSLSYRIKVFFFNEYGSNIPDYDSVQSPSQNAAWVAPGIPEWVINEMRAIGREVDSALFPTDKLVASMQYYSFPVISAPGRLYREFLSHCSSSSYSYCYAIPWLKRGGADLISLLHIRQAAQQQDAKVLVLMTEPGDSPWVDRLPSGVDLIDVSKHVNDIAYEELIFVLTRLLIQLNIDVLHIVNSRYVWEIVCRYGLALSSKTKIFASIFCDDYDKYGRPVGFARDYLPRSYQFLKGVLTDNYLFAKLLQETYGYDENLFYVVRVPIRQTEKAQRLPLGRRVLWAGRLDRQKRPDLLHAIIKRMHDVEFWIYGEVTLDLSKEIISSLRRQKNVRLMGAFDGVENLPFTDFPVFLYTSQWDGTPTVIVAAANAAIPIVASCVGGIGEIVNQSTGFPIYNIESIDDYVQALEFVFKDPYNAEARARRGRELVQTLHSYRSFEDALMKVPGYMRQNLIAGGLNNNAHGEF